MFHGQCFTEHRTSKHHQTPEEITMAIGKKEPFVKAKQGQRPESIWVSIQELQKQSGGRPQPDMSQADGIHIDKLRFATDTFQPRTMRDRNRQLTPQSQYHIAQLKMATKTYGGPLPDPITIWWSGRNWFVIDGHHRIAAYRQVVDFH
jgi:hypothetical protein